MMKTSLASLSLLLGLCASAGATVLNFDGAAGCASDWFGAGPGADCDPGSGGPVLQGFGDQAGLHIEYRDLSTPDNWSLSWWKDGYNDLPGALYAGSEDAGSHASITLQALPGYQVKLNGFALGAWLNSSLGTQVHVYEVGGAQTLLQAGVTAGDANTNTATLLSFAVAASSQGWVIEWQDSAYSVGLGRLDFEVTAVPEPQSWLLLLAGLAGVGGLARQRRPR